MRLPSGKWIRLAGILAYLLLLGVLFEFDWNRMLQPAPLLSVLLGTLVLTLSQWKKGDPVRNLPERLKWNAFVAGMLTSLFSILTLMSGGWNGQATLSAFSDSLMPFFYASLFALPWHRRALPGERGAEEDAQVPDTTNPPTRAVAGTLPDWQQEWLLARRSAEAIHKVLSRQGFTPRECHVAQKMLEDAPNREIAESLYISESTVKKHIQNLFRKCGATDRRTFRKLFLAWESAQRQREQTDPSPSTETSPESQLPAD